MEIKQLHTDKNKLLAGFVESRIGGRRENQDSFDAKELPSGFVVTVCDGMGGGPGGKIASAIAVREIVMAIGASTGDEPIPDMLVRAVKQANLSIIEAGENEPALRGMGSTATVLFINDYAAYVAHVGDSRVYQLRGHKKLFRTFDHSMVFDLVKQGVITEEQARLSAQSNVITRALGISPDVEVEVAEMPYEKGDRFMLTTDGVHGAMSERELVRLASSRKNVLGAIVDNIATIVDDIGVSTGASHDNLTVAIIETKHKSKLNPIMSRNTRIFVTALSLVCLLSVGFNLKQYSKYNSGIQTSAFKAKIDSMSSKLQEKEDSIQRLSTDLRACQSNIDSIKSLQTLFE